MSRRHLNRLGVAVLALALLAGVAAPAFRYAAMAVFTATALLTVVTTRPAHRGRS